MKKLIYKQIVVSIVMLGIFFVVWERTADVSVAVAAVLVLTAVLQLAALIVALPAHRGFLAERVFYSFAINAIVAIVALVPLLFGELANNDGSLVFLFLALLVTAFVVTVSVFGVATIAKEEGGQIRFSHALGLMLIQVAVVHGIAAGAQFGLSARVVLPVVVLLVLAGALLALPLIRADRRRRLVDEEQELVEALSLWLHNAKVRQVAEERLAEVRARLAKVNKQNV